ncbi:hypothetical protein [Bacillus coahuilensis]|uniref:hypothetical protein n=1 Tax=Bacillus coahuilensis TaxID=408580 RepID=UPI000185130C|nr:hypothetical protein [Bacillus coahuilensis]
MGQIRTEEELNELEKCANDIVYFANTYIWFNDKKRGIVQFEAYPFQADFLLDLCEHQKNIVLKSRQMGLSWTALIWALHRCLFFFDQKGLILSMDKSAADDALNRIKVMYDYLPDFLKGDLGDNSKSIIEFKDMNSMIKSVAMTESAGRSDTPTFAIWDEMAFPRKGVDPYKVWDSLKPALGETGKFIGISTPNGFGNLFHRFWTQGEERGFRKTQIHWTSRPDRVGSIELFNELEERRKRRLQPTTEQVERVKAVSHWYEMECKDMDDDKFSQEYEMNFLNSGRPAFSISKVLKQFDNVLDKFNKLNDHIEQYKKPEAGVEYIAAFDTSEGTGGDNNAFGIFTRDGEQVLEYACNNVPLRNFTDEVVGLCRLYNDALLVVERNNTGIGAIERIQETHNYFNLYYSPRDGKAGWHTGPVSRPIMISDLRELINKEELIIRSTSLIEELRVFSYDEKDTPKAPTGYKDDRVLMLAIFGQAIKGGVEPVAIRVSPSKRKRRR